MAKGTGSKTGFHGRNEMKISSITRGRTKAKTRIKTTKIGWKPEGEIDIIGISKRLSPTDTSASRRDIRNR